MVRLSSDLLQRLDRAEVVLAVLGVQAEVRTERGEGGGDHLYGWPLAGEQRAYVVKAVESAALEAAGSNTRGTGWALSGAASPWEWRQRALRRHRS